MRGLLISFLLVLGIDGSLFAATALSVSEPSPSSHIAVLANRVLGWEFTANQPIVVTHLGLFDDDNDGFEIDLPIALFRVVDAIPNPYGVKLASGVISAGASGPLIDRFRYVAITDVALEVNQHYFVAYHTGVGSFDSFLGGSLPSLSVDHSITYLRARSVLNPDLVFSTLTSSITDNIVGPNFLFAVPEPTTSALALAAVCLAMGRRRCS